jgi:DNA polymerase-3 subunit beta
MKALCNREGLLTAFTMISGVVPSRSPKPILQNVKLVAEVGEGSTLMATDLEVAIRHRVLGMKVEEAGLAVLPTARFGSILRTSTDPELFLEMRDGQLMARYPGHAEFKLPAEDPALYPEVPDFAATSYHVIAAADLRKLIRRTIFATDVESTRFALGGVLVELTDDTITMVGTDGRRLARMSAPAEAENGATPPAGSPVVPVKALKLIERNLDDGDPPVHIAIQGTAAVLIRTERAVIYSRLVEGRFPNWQAVMPKKPAVTISLPVAGFQAAVRQAAIMAESESPRVTFKFARDRLTLIAQGATSGRSKIEMPIEYDGKPIDINFNPAYVVEMLKILPPDSSVMLDLIDGANPALLRYEKDYSYLIMPLT